MHKEPSELINRYYMVLLAVSWAAISMKNVTECLGIVDLLNY